MPFMHLGGHDRGKKWYYFSMFRLLKKYTKDGWWAALLGPVFTAAEVAVDALIPLVMSDIIDKGIYGMNGDMEYIWQRGVYMVILALLGALFGALSGLFSSIASTRFIRNIRFAMFSKIQEYSFENIEKYPVPTVVMRLTADMRMLRMAYVSIVRMLIRAPINLALSAYFVFTMNASLASIFAVTIPILGVGLFFIYTKAHPRFRQMMLKFDALDANLEENIEGIRVVKTFVREGYETEKFDRSSESVMKAQRFAEKIVILNRPFFELVMYACMVIIAWVGGKDVIAGTMTTGNGLSVRDLTRIEIAQRRENWEKVLEMRDTPGWEKVYTSNSASQLGVRQSRLVDAEFIVGRKEIADGFDIPDPIGWCGHDGPHEAFRIPYRQILPKKVDHVLCAGRCLGKGDTIDTFRLICPCFVTGQAAGVAAALSAKKGIAPRALPYSDLAAELERQGVALA